MSVSVRTLDKKIIQDAANWALLQAYLNQHGMHIWRSPQKVTIAFESTTTADEFHRFIVNARARK